MTRGFSLVEVVLALGVVSFALVVTVALLPVGVRLSDEAESESRAVNMLSGLLADRAATSATNVSTVYGIPPLTAAATNTLNIAENWEIVSNPNDARFRVQYKIHPAAATPGLAKLWLRATWPAQNTNSPSAIETLVAYPMP